MDKKPIIDEYVVPEIDVIKINSLSLICQSGNTQQYDNGEWNL